VTCSYPDLVAETGRRSAVDQVRLVRERIRSRRSTRIVYRIVVGLLGIALTVGGLLLVPLPGPGWLIVFAGLALLATEFEPARRLLDFGRRQVAAWTAWLGRQGVVVRGAVLLGTAGCVVAALYAVALVVGLPGWVPAGLVSRVPGLDQ
jgi:uncharacterized protein (TIGR02611 family)